MLSLAIGRTWMQDLLKSVVSELERAGNSRHSKMAFFSLLTQTFTPKTSATAAHQEIKRETSKTGVCVGWQGTPPLDYLQTGAKW